MMIWLPNTSECQDQLRTATQSFKFLKNIYSTGNAFTVQVTANVTKSGRTRMVVHA